MTINRDALRGSLQTIVVYTALAAGVFWLHHVWLVNVLRSGMKLGALYDRKFAPLYAGAGLPEFPLLALPAAAGVLALVVFGARSWLSGRIATTTAGIMGVLTFAVLASIVSMIDGIVKVEGVEYPAIVAPFAPTEGKHEYFWDVPIIEKVGGVWEFIARFHRPGVTSRLSLHGSTHPPGPILLLWAVGELFGRSLWVGALTAIAFSSVSVVLVFLLAKTAYGAETARWAALMWLLTPNVLMYSATSMDGPMATAILLVILLYYRGLASPRWMTSLMFGVSLALAVFMTFVAAVVVVLFCLDWLWAGRRDFAKRLRHAAIGAGAFFGSYLAAYLTLGYHPIETLRGAMAANADLMGSNHETAAQYLNVSLANLSAFLFAVGLAWTALWIRDAVERAKDRQLDDLPGRFPLVGASTLLLLAFSTLFHLELERVWIFFAPLVVIPAAHYLKERCAAAGSRVPFYCASGLIATQLLAMELFLATRW